MNEPTLLVSDEARNRFRDEAACEQSGTVALPWAHIKTHTATEQAVRNLSQDGRKAQD